MWTGTPLDRENHGCFLDRGTLLCLVGDEESLDAVVFVDEADLPYVQVGQRVSVRLEHAIADEITGQVVEIAEINTEVAPAELTAQHDVAVRRNESGARAPIRTIYQVRVALDATNTPMLIGARGRAQIVVDPQTIAQRVTRWLRHTLTIDAPLGDDR
jgi:putative peptide zinc metalloprotease protein